MTANTPCPERASLEAEIARGNRELRRELERVRYELDLAIERARPRKEVFEPPDPVTVLMFAGLAVLIMLVGWT